MTTAEPTAPLEPVLRVLAVAGSLNSESVTRIVVGEAARQLTLLGCSVDLLDLLREPLLLYNPDFSHDAPAFPALQRRVEQADVILLGTPDYHGSISSAMKNFLDHFWREFACGKLFAAIVASRTKKVSTVTDQLRTGGAPVNQLCLDAALWNFRHWRRGCQERQRHRRRDVARRLEMMTCGTLPSMAACWPPNVAPTWPRRIPAFWRG